MLLATDTGTVLVGALVGGLAGGFGGLLTATIAARSAQRIARDDRNHQAWAETYVMLARMFDVWDELAQRASRQLRFPGDDRPMAIPDADSLAQMQAAVAVYGSRRVRTAVSLWLEQLSVFQMIQSELKIARGVQDGVNFPEIYNRLEAARAELADAAEEARRAIRRDVQDDD